MNSLLQLSIDRPKAGNLIILAVVCMGCLSIGVIRYEVMPKIDLGVVTVTTVKAGASPEEVELSITTPLEEELLKVNGIRKVFSNSLENLSLITLNLDPDVEDKTKLLTDIQKAVDRSLSKLPKDLTDKPTVEELGSDKLPVAELHITGPVSESVLRSEARHWQRKLREVIGVSAVERIGYRKPEVSIRLDQQKQFQLGVSYDEIREALALRSVRDSGGSLTSFTGEKKVLAVGQFQDPLNIGNIIIRSREPGNNLLLRDIASIIPDYEKWQVQVRSDGQLSIALQIMKKDSADELKTIDAIKTLLEDQQSQLQDGLELKLINDVSRFTKDMLNTLNSNALLGLLSVFLILWLFLGRKMAFWVSVGLPFSVLSTFSLLFVLGHSINSLVLMAIILVLGMLVDDAIVTGEAIQHRLESGLSRRDAAIRGTKDIAAPVSVSVLTTILAFFPLFFIGGLEGAFVSAIPVVVMIMLLASLFESKFLLPAHLAHSNFKARQRSWLIRGQEVYRKVILWMLERRKWVTVMLIALFILVTFVSGSFVRFQLYPDTAIDTIHVKTELPSGTSFEQTASRIAELEQDIRANIHNGDLLNIVSQIGHHDTDIYGASEGRNQCWALTTVYLKAQNQMSSSQKEILTRLKNLAKEQNDFVSIRVEPLKDTPVLGKAVELEIMADGNEKLIAADTVSEFLKDQPWTTDVWDSRKSGKPIVDLHFHHQKLSAYHLSVKQVADAVRASLDGLLIYEQQMAAERVYFRLKTNSKENRVLRSLQNLYVVNGVGKPVPLSGVANYKLRPGEADIKHYSGRRSVTVYANIDRKLIDVATANEKVAGFIKAQYWSNIYPDLSFYHGGEIEQQQTSYDSLVIAFAACLFAILFVLIVLFNSYSQPFLILAVLPFSVMGVFLAFAVQGMPMSFLALIGLLGLIGVLVNDAVVMIFTLNKEAKSRDMQLIAKQASTRFRPIFITSLTTLVGLFPTAYGWGGYNPFVAPMVMVMAWGVAFGTVISLMLLPCLFALNEDLRHWLGLLRITKISPQMVKGTIRNMFFTARG